MGSISNSIKIPRKKMTAAAISNYYSLHEKKSTTYMLEFLKVWPILKWFWPINKSRTWKRFSVTKINKLTFIYIRSKDFLHIWKKFTRIDLWKIFSLKSEIQVRVAAPHQSFENHKLAFSNNETYVLFDKYTQV